MLDFQGRALDVLSCRAPIARIEGGAGTGKTLATMFKLHTMCEHFPGTQVRILRDTKTSLNTSVIPQMMQMIGDRHPCYRDADPENISQMRYPNGSNVIFGGLDNVSRIMGADIDFVWVNEATVNVSFEDIQYLVTRFRGKIRSPYRQMILDMNPSYPLHWANTWEEDEENVRIKTTLKDNPLFYDEGKGEYTAAGETYIRNLKKVMTGTARKRMLEGVWAAQEGAVFANLSNEYHAFNRSHWGRGLPNLPVIVGLDWGIADPFAALAIIVDREHRACYVIDERYEKGLTTKQQRAEVADMCKGLDVRHLYFDPSMSNRQARGADGQYGPPAIVEFESLPFPLSPGLNQTRLANIEFIMGLITAAETGDDERYALYIDPDRCPNLWRELEGATWYQDKRGGWKEDIDPRCPDHAITALFYALRTHLTDSGGIVIPAQFSLVRGL